MLYAILRSMACVHKEYQFSLQYFISLFDEAVGGELPSHFTDFLEMAHVSLIDSDTDIRTHGPGPNYCRFCLVIIFCLFVLFISINGKPQKTTTTVDKPLFVSTKV